ncbi:MAG: prolipoprotein diacylglyceryl transferase [Candidatus Gastranaerophilales bacterium]|nr:prolipoprotein diacylglyceryl transferase [Candidatus Gastranaerophilales bacterium]
MFTSPGSIAFTVYNLDIHWYGIIMSLAIIAGLIVIFLIRNKYFKDIKQDSIFDLSFDIIVFGIIGARLYYVIMDYSYFLRHPFEIPAIWNGGLSIQGAILGGIIAGLLYAKKYNINFLRYADLFSFGLVTGQIIGRWGNFFNSEAFGLPSSLPWKLFIQYQFRPVEYKNYEYFHPAFLYESILNLLILILLIFLLSGKNDIKNGTIFFLYIILYSLVRLLVETIRTDSVLNIGCFHIAHIASFAFLAAGIIGLYFVYKKN